MDVKSIEFFNALYGHKDFKEKTLDSELLKYYISLGEILDDYPIGNEWDNVMDYKQDSKAFMSNLFTLHDIGYSGPLRNKTFKNLIKKDYFESIDSAADFYNSLVSFIDPYELTIFSGGYAVPDAILINSEVAFKDEKTVLELLRKVNVYFNRIQMSSRKNYNKSTSLSYVVANSQLDSNKGIIKDFYNGEVISNFVKLLHSYNISNHLFYNTLIIILQEMFYDFVKILTDDVNSDDDSFNNNLKMRRIISKMKAINLFDLYIRSDESIRKEIISSIQSNFDGELFVEDTLNKFDINTTSSTDSNKVIQLLR